MIRFCVTNHGSEITLFLLYIVNLSLMSTTASIYSLSPKTSLFVSKVFQDTEKNTTTYFAILLKQTHVTVCCILLTFFFFLHFPDARKSYGHPLLSVFAFCLGFQKQLAVFLSSCVFNPEKSSSFLLVHGVEKVKITSSIESRLPSLCVCVTAWCGCELYCMYICAFIHVGVCVCIYVCVIIRTCNIHTVIHSHAYVNTANPILFWY